jgi:hypothetical protein
MKHLNPKQVLAVLEVARENSTRDWAILLLAFRHALRSQKVRQLGLSLLRGLATLPCVSQAICAQSAPNPWAHLNSTSRPWATNAAVTT